MLTSSATASSSRVVVLERPKSLGRPLPQPWMSDKRGQEINFLGLENHLQLKRLELDLTIGAIQVMLPPLKIILETVMTDFAFQKGHRNGVGRFPAAAGGHGV